MKINFKKSLEFNLKIVLLIMILAILSGVAGELLIRFYVFKDLYSLPIYNDVNLTGTDYGQTAIVINDPRKVVVNQDLKVRETAKSLDEVAIAFFLKKKATSTSSELADYYNLKTPLFTGLNLTADGWVLVDSSMVSGLKSNPSAYVAILKNKKIYSPDKVVLIKNSNWSLVHLASAQNLVVKNISATTDVYPGQIVLAVDWNGQVWQSAVRSVADENLIKNSDYLNNHIVLSETPPADFQGVYLFDLAGDILGIISGGQVDFLGNFKSPLFNFLASGEMSAPALGVNYINLSQLAKIDNNSNSALNKDGAWVYSDSRLAVVKGSPAESVGLRSGDIILAVGGVNIDVDNDLNYLISQYAPKSKLMLKYLRDGNVSEVEVTLGEIKY